MTIESAEAEYSRLLSIRSTPEELATGLKALREGMDRMNITYYPLCDNDTEDPYP